MYNLLRSLGISFSWLIVIDLLPSIKFTSFLLLQFVELHGDRGGYDDPAIVTGIGSIDGKSYMFIGHQKGRNTKENIQRNFGMPTPHGYVH